MTIRVLGSIGPKACALFLLSGCVIQGSGFGGWGKGASSADARYDGSECDEVRETEAQAKYSSDDKGKRIEHPTTKQYALAAVCRPMHFTENDPSSGLRDSTRELLVGQLDLETLHRSFDDRKIDAVKAALFTIEVVDGDPYQPKSKKHLKDFKKDDDEGYEDEMLLGLGHLYATMAKPTLAAALDKLGMPPDAKAAFLARFDGSSKEIDDLLATMPAAKKKIFVEIPQSVHAARTAYFSAHAADYKSLDALELDADKARAGQGDPAAVAASLTALRTAYVAATGSESCTYDPLYVEVTGELSRVYLAAKQPLLAIAEAKVLARKDANQHGFAQELFAAQNEASLRAREAWELKEKAKGKGLDEATTSAVVGTATPLRFNYGTFWDAPTSLPDLSDLSESKGVHADSGYIQSVKPKGATATVDFKTEYDTVDEPYNCRRTGRLERIQDDGTLVWEEVCQYSTKKLAREKPAPITVLAADARGLKSGELLTAVVEGATRAAVVLDVYKEKAMVQLRGDRLAATPKDKDKAKGKGGAAVKSSEKSSSKSGSPKVAKQAG